MSDKTNKKSLFTRDTKAAADLLIALAVIVIALIFYIDSKSLPTKDLGIGPGDYPRVVCILLFILGFAQILKIVIVKRTIPLIDWEKIDRPQLLRFAISAAVSFVFFKLLKIVGFPLLAPVYLFFIIMFFGYKSWRKALVISIVFTTSMYFLFTRVFLVMLPAGILG